MSSPVTRRGFVKLLGTGIASVYFNGCSSAPVKIWANDFYQKSQLSLASPIRRNLPAKILDFSGDHPNQAHSILWNKEKWMASVGVQFPADARQVDVAIVGGGMSGLLSAYFLRHKNPVLLDQAPQFGGNSRGEEWQGIEYGIGAGYIMKPEAGSEIDQFLREVGLSDKGRIWDGADPALVGKTLYPDPYTYGTLPGTREDFQRVFQHYRSLFDSTANGIPEVPAFTSEERARLNELDGQSLIHYLRKSLGDGRALNPHVEEYIESYCWTAFGASSQEVSASAGLNFMASEVGGRVVFSGGNAQISERVFEILSQTFKPDQFLPSSLVFDAKDTGTGVQLSYLNASGKPEFLKAKQVVFACPKFIVAKILRGLEPERLKAIEALKYRAYLVANVLIDAPLEARFHDLYFFDGHENPLSPGGVKNHAKKQKATDLFHSCFTRPNSKRSVLTLCRAFPYDGGRSELYTQNSYAHWQKEFKDQVLHQILPALKLPASKLVDIRVTRWGHPLPVPSVGIYRSGQADALRKPFSDRVFFIQQDNWALPCFETAFGEANHWHKVILAASS